MSNQTLKLHVDDLNACAAFAASDPRRAVICGVHLCVHNGEALMVATDGLTLITLSLGDKHVLPENLRGVTFDPLPLLPIIAANGENKEVNLSLDAPGILVLRHEGFAKLCLELSTIAGTYPTWHECLPRGGPQPRQHICLSLELLSRVREVMQRCVHTKNLCPQVVIYPWPSSDEKGSVPMIIRPLNGPLQDRAVFMMMPVRIPFEGKPPPPLPDYLLNPQGAEPC